MERGAAMLAVVLDVYEGGKDLIPRLDAEGACGKRICNRGRRRAQAVLRGMPDWFGPPSEDNPRG